MKLNLVPARTGFAWIRLGIRTFSRQPLALAGLFLMYLMLMSLVGLLPVVGTVLALVLLPAAMLGLMAATEEVARGQFPMPLVLASAFRAGRQRARAALALGVLYAVGFLLVMGISSLFDGGSFARLYLQGGGNVTSATMRTPAFQAAMGVGLLLNLPLSMLFWHAPALVHWHGVPPLKSLFFSFVACLRNFGAFVVYALSWFALIALVTNLLLLVLVLLLGNSELVNVIIAPVMLLLAAMFFTSIYFTFRDCFAGDETMPLLPAES